MDQKANILKWYPFEEGASLLEIYEEKNILENINSKINYTSCDIQSLQLEGEYDYITLIGTYEYAPIVCEGENPYISFLKELEKHLKPNGKILLAIDNQLGIKYFAGAKNKHYSKIFEGLGSQIRAKRPNLLLKTELESFIKQAGFQNYKFYYPLPDYHNTSCIFTDQFLPKSNHSKIIYPVHYEEGSIVLYNEIDVIKQICDIGRFTDFTNSYLIEISNKEIENQIKFVNYNIFRKKEYQLIVKIYEDCVKKMPENDKAKEHIKQIQKYIEHLKQLDFEIIEDVQDNAIVSPFIKAEELDKIIVKQIRQGNIEEAYQEIEKWYQYIKERLQKEEITGKNAFNKYKISIPNEQEEQLHFIKSGYIDLSFENIFYKEDKYYFYDQEWYIENIPLEFILYRAINNLYAYNINTIKQIISKEELLEKFGLTEFIMYFEELEKVIQVQILEEDVVKEYIEQTKQYYKELEYLNQTEYEIKIQQEEYNKLKEEKEKIESDYNKLLQEYNTSRGWKLIKMGRKLLGKGS